MTALPNQGQLIVPIDWSGATQKTTMQAAAYTLSGTVGWRPYQETATLTWMLSKADAQTMLNAFRATNFNGIFDYTCALRGAVRLRLMGDYSFAEVRGSQLCQVTATVNTV